MYQLINIYHNSTKFCISVNKPILIKQVRLEQKQTNLNFTGITGCRIIYKKSNLPCEVSFFTITSSNHFYRPVLGRLLQPSEKKKIYSPILETLF